MPEASVRSTCCVSANGAPAPLTAVLAITLAVPTRPFPGPESIKQYGTIVIFSNAPPPGRLQTRGSLDASHDRRAERDRARREPRRNRARGGGEARRPRR